MYNYFTKLSLTRCIISLLGIWMVIILPIYQSNAGGSGLALPQNIFAWAAMALSTSIVFLSVATKKSIIRLTFTAKLFFLGAVVLSIPLLYTHNEWRENALWRCAGLLGGCFFYLACLQLKLTYQKKIFMLYVILLAVGIQAVLAYLQLFYPGMAWIAPVDNRIFAVFQQPNVLASFIATGLSLALMLLLSSSFLINTNDEIQLYILLLVILLLTTLLVLIQSRAGWLGGSLSVFLLLWRFSRKKDSNFYLACGALSLGVAVGTSILLTNFGMTNSTNWLSHESSNNARIAMIRDTISMIMAKPLLGWGYGGFEYSLLHFRLENHPSREVLEITRHPHNELLLWIAEGGLPALVGITIILLSGMLLVYRSLRRDNTEGIFLRTGLIIVTLPIIIHTQLEYPFYLSTPHWLLFLLLLSIADNFPDTRVYITIPKFLSFSLMLSFLMIFILAIFSWRGGLVLTSIERNGLKNISSLHSLPEIAFWVHRERRSFDEQTHALLVYNQTHNEIILIKYREWADAYLKRHIDSNVYATLITILRHQRLSKEAYYRQMEAAYFFPHDQRFKVKR